MILLRLCVLFCTCDGSTYLIFVKERYCWRYLSDRAETSQYCSYILVLLTAALRFTVQSLYTLYGEQSHSFSTNLCIFSSLYICTVVRAFSFFLIIIFLFHLYLTGRRQYVNYKGAEFYTFDCPSVVPQGCNLGPMLFLLCINDIANTIRHSHPLLYADDIKLYKEIKTEEDSELLQQYLDKLANWSTENCLSFNIKKCESITFSRKRNPF